MLRAPFSPRSRWRRLTVVVVVLAALGCAGWLITDRVTGLPDDAAFAIGADVVTTNELARQVDALRALYDVRAPVDDPARMDDFRRKTAKAVATAFVLDRQARTMHINISDGQVRSVLDAYIARSLGPGAAGQEEFGRVLGNAGTSQAVVTGAIRRQLAVNVMFDQVTRAVQITPETLVAEFPRYRQRLDTPETRHLANIVVASESRAREILAQLNSGADFAAVARTESLDGAAQRTGGDLGVRAVDQLTADYGRSAFAAPSGGVFGPVRTESGWNVGIVLDVHPGRSATYEEAKDRLARLVVADEKWARWNRWLRQVMRDAEVRYAVRYQPSDADEAGDTASPLAPVPGAAPPSGSSRKPG